MSMIGNLTRIPDDARVALHENPSAIHLVLHPDDDPEQEPIHALSDGDKADLDKTWHALHFLFTGSNWEGDFPQGFLVSCGDEIGDVDVGYGPARSFSAAQVKEIAEFLARLDLTELKGNFDFAAMQELHIYPNIWDDPADLEDEWEYVMGGLDELVSFVKETAEKGFALLVYLN